MQSSTISDFLEQLASAEPTPGGGGAAALMGAMGMGLIAMVARVTLGKKGQETAIDELTTQVHEADAYCARFSLMIKEDAQAFDALMAAFKLPKDSVEAIDTRAIAIQRGYEGATEVPLCCMRMAVEGLQLAQRSARLGHRNVLSDSGVAVHSLLAALKSSALNVAINVPAIRDDAFVTRAQTEVSQLTEKADILAADTLALVSARLS
ncbi:MAG: cyclodeaminase/cyclohydrolase family protein [Betaproteobacteria bacterium]|nr:cyclodeaminase/cyclohydrolase family protein [Betaproteobacteria bacterium]